MRIGDEFKCNGKRWRCTDVGTRTVIAIQIDPVVITRMMKDGVKSNYSMSMEEAEAIGWFEGPPYACAEMVFDEDGIACVVEEKFDDNRESGIAEAEDLVRRCLARFGQETSDEEIRAAATKIFNEVSKVAKQVKRSPPV